MILDNEWVQCILLPECPHMTRHILRVDLAYHSLSRLQVQLPAGLFICGLLPVWLGHSSAYVRRNKDCR